MFIKKIILSVFFLLYSDFLLFSKQNFSLETNPFFALKCSELTKSIYLNSKDTKISELLWEQKPAYMFGLQSKFYVEQFSIEAQFSFSLPISCGSMYDSDWNLAGLKKTYSIHQCEILQDFDSNLFVSYSIPIIRKFSFTIAPSVGIKYLYASLNAHDGYGWYGGAEVSKPNRNYDVSWDSPLARKAKKIRDIDYYRHNLFVFVGSDFSFKPVNRLLFLAGFYFSPYAYSYSMDTHHRSGESSHYLDIQHGFFSKFMTRSGVNFFITKNIAVSANFSSVFGFTDFGKLYSDEYSENLTEFTDQPSSSNIWNCIFEIGIIFTI